MNDINNNTEIEEAEQRKPLCPLGENNCPVHCEVESLRDQIVDLSNRAHTDALTGLFNRHYMTDALECEIERTERNYQPTSLILLDVDHFKAVNDNYGHVVGDAVLKHISKIIQETVRKLDIPCRYGGEEFAIILPSASVMMGSHVAERIRARIEQIPLIVDGKPLPVTVSLGVDTYFNGTLEVIEKFIDRADNLLYKAKSEGRNRVCCVQQLDADKEVSQDEKDALFSML